MDIGNTRIEKAKFGLIDIYIKHEEENPTGSFKDRSISYLLNYYINKGNLNFCISSSGNAAISASYFASINEKNPKLDIFVSPNLDRNKLDQIYGYINSNENSKKNISLHFTKKAKSECFKFSLKNNCINLRGSDDDNALIGYRKLGEELNNIEFDSVFITTSSGTSALGIYEGLDKSKPLPALYICQTTKVHPIAGEFDKDFKNSDTSIVSCVVDKVAKRKDSIVNLVKNTKGSGFVVSDEEVWKVKEVSDENNWSFSLNSAVALAGLQKALKYNFNIKSPLVINSGK